MKKKMYLRDLSTVVLHRKPKPVINTISAAVTLLSRYIRRKQEHCVVIFLNSQCGVIGIETIFLGDEKSIDVSPAMVFRVALRRGASYIVMAHNHPTGDPQPSDSDIKLAKQMRQAGEILCLNVLDSLVIAKNGYVSINRYLAAQSRQRARVAKNKLAATEAAESRRRIRRRHRKRKTDKTSTALVFALSQRLCR